MVAERPALDVEAAAGSGTLRVLFMGTPELSIPCGEAVHREFELVGVVTRPDRPAGRGRSLSAPPVKRWAAEHGVPVEQFESLRGEEARERLAAYEPDVVVVVAYGLLLPPEILSIPRLGCVNVHLSLLPRHRGASPVQAAILAGDEETGVTTMLMDEGLDTGPVLLQSREPVRPDDTAGSLTSRLAERGADLLVETLARLDEGDLQPVPQDEDRATMTRLVRKSDGRIDWRGPAARVERHVRAMRPWPSPTARLGDTVLKLWRVEVAGPAPEDARPGEVLESEDELVVACGEGTSIRVLEMQRPGGRRMPTKDLLRGFPIPVGSVLDGA